MSQYGDSRDNGNCGAAPLGSVRDSAASFNSYPLQCGRRRRRGPRSTAALQRRFQERCSDAPSNIVAGESATLTSEVNTKAPPSFYIYSINIKRLCARLKELCYRIASHFSHIISIQATWHDRSVGHVFFPNYHILARKDKSETGKAKDLLIEISLERAH